jgi:antitoxin component YwqK of YwqJK toxin-antitoxin module
METPIGDWNYYGECDINSVPSGVGRVINNDGSMFIESFFKNGQFQGLVRCIYKNGEYLEVEFKDGDPIGKLILYRCSGIKLFESNYFNGQKHGKEIGYHGNQTIHYEINYVNG